MDELAVWMEGELIGTLERADARRLVLTYDDAWIARESATPLSLSLPRAERQHSGDPVASYLWGLLPEGDVLTRWAQEFECRRSDLFCLIRGVGADVAGAAQFLPVGRHPDERGRQATALSEADIAELLAGISQGGAAWHAAGGGQWSLAGAQSKIALAYDPASQQWSRPSGAEATTHILKPTISGLEFHDVNEHVCLRVARLLGMEAARSEVRFFDDERVLVVERFDRRRASAGTVRVHQEDFCQALSVFPDQKYQSEGGPGTERMVELLSSLGSEGDSRNVRRLIHAVALNWLLLGTDAHVKNYSLLLSGQQVRLAPVYDIASALPYGHPRKLRLAQKVGGEYRPTVITRRHWERLANAAGIDGEQLIDEIIDMAERIPDAGAAAAGELPADTDESRFALRLVDLVATWAGDCRRALTAGSA